MVPKPIKKVFQHEGETKHLGYATPEQRRQLTKNVKYKGITTSE
jgi:hypothetical protein